jgi:hypothetical protein
MTALHKASGDRVSTTSVLGGVEGYLALLFVALPLLGPTVDHPGNPIGSAVYVGIAFGLALGGLRFGKGGGRFAALAALGVLSLWLLIVLAASIVRWEQVLSVPTRRRHETQLDAMLFPSSQCVADAKPNFMRHNPRLCGICKPIAVA